MPPLRPRMIRVATQRPAGCALTRAMPTQQLVRRGVGEINLIDEDVEEEDEECANFHCKGAKDHNLTFMANKSREGKSYGVITFGMGGLGRDKRQVQRVGLNQTESGVFLTDSHSGC